MTCWYYQRFHLNENHIRREKIKGKKKKEMTKTLQIEKYCASEIQCGTTQYAEQPHPTCQYKELSQTGG